MVEDTRGDEVRFRVLGSDNDGDGTFIGLEEPLDGVRACKMGIDVRLDERVRLAGTIRWREGEDGEVLVLRGLDGRAVEF